jgi:hypothetical protein
MSECDEPIPLGVDVGSSRGTLGRMQASAHMVDIGDAARP